jgi:signal transduction histidine kinase
VDGDPILRERAREVIVREARRLVHMIENVLLFSRSGSTRLPMNLCVESVGNLVTAAMADLEPLLASRQVSPQIAIAPETDALVDPGAVRQIVFNLIDNAIRYGPEKQTLHINVMRNGSCVELSVDDAGPGIPVADRRRIWKPFRTRGRNRGTGIGLPLVRRLAIEMGGGAEVLDGTRGGARVRVWFGLSPNGGPKRNIDARHAAGASR